jgi:hypothetical protein
MSLPAGISVVTLSGTLLSPDGTGTSGSIHFIPSVSILYTGQDVVTMPQAVVVPLATGGTFAVVLPATDDTAGNPTGWTWHVVERIKGGRVFDMPLPKNPGTVDYSSVVPVPSSDGTAVIVGPPGPALTAIDGGTP